MEFTSFAGLIEITGEKVHELLYLHILCNYMICYKAIDRHNLTNLELSHNSGIQKMVNTRTSYQRTVVQNLEAPLQIAIWKPP